jgi:2-methylcitrate dehydratase PrpD
VTVTTESGTCERRVTAVPGDPSRPFSADDVAAKFRRFVTPVIGEKGAEDLLAAASAAVDGRRPPAELMQAVERCIT